MSLLLDHGERIIVGRLLGLLEENMVGDLSFWVAE